MRPLLAPDEMAAADRAAIEAGTPASVLMERAGRAVARAVIEVGGGRYGCTVAVVCGKGNNGGDGFVAARVLRREGLSVRCFGVGDVWSARGAAREKLDLLARAGVAIEDLHVAELDRVDVIVDAIFGTGFRGRALGAPAKAITAMNDALAPVVAVDIPSGVDGATGAAEGPAVRAEVTVAMAAEKLGTATGAGALDSGRVEVADIAIPVSRAKTHMVERRDVADALPHRSPDAHKRSGGAVALLAGSGGMTGAAVLSARGAVRTGAGYATVGGTSSVDAVVAATLPEVLSKVVTDQDVLGPEALADFSPVLDRANVLAIGPGLGAGSSQRALVEKVLATVDLPMVVDADGLNVLAGHSRPLGDRKSATVITPHPGELARLLGVSTEDIQADRVTAARSAAERFSCVVLLKGFRTVIAEPQGDAVVNPTGGAELATAGTGDVLTGVVAALMAADLEPMAAAWAGAYVHGLAGHIAAAEHGTAGVLAWDVAEALGEAVDVCARE